MLWISVHYEPDSPSPRMLAWAGPIDADRAQVSVVWRGGVRTPQFVTGVADTVAAARARGDAIIRESGHDECGASCLPWREFQNVPEVPPQE